jgi:hypothetical protein
MNVHEIRSCLERVYHDLGAIVHDGSTDAAALRNRVRWLNVFDPLDELKEDLLQGRGRNWPPAIHGVYVSVRTGVKEVFDLLLGGPKESRSDSIASEDYCIGRLIEYRIRLQDAIARITPVDSSSSIS